MSIGATAFVLAVVLTFPSAASAALGDCGQPVTGGANPTASDCLFILKTAVGAQTCEPVCICDTSGGAGTTASDALICLKSAVGQSGVSLDCPCAVTTTTTPSPTTTIPSPTTTAGPITTTTIIVTTTLGPTTTTTSPTNGIVLQGVLAKTNGRFNFNVTIGLPGADATCNTNFTGTHACTFTDLLDAEAAGDLDGLRDPADGVVRHFWAIDSARPDDDQCTVTVAWDYATVHTGQFADQVPLDNATGDLGTVASGVVCATQSWVGCCL